ncbi:MAG: glycosyltransferase [Cytophagales bacterium]|nr:glycosyltransferase [Cytophagales bacterium]
MRFFFIVQGEGRGHMTQAMALSTMLRSNGHQICRVVVGESNRRIIPKFFFEGIGAPVAQVASPNFITDSENRSVKLWSSIIMAFSNLGEYRRSIRTIHRYVKEDQPDVIINFYDFVGGIYNKLKSPSSNFICIAHQYLAGHSSFEYAKGGVFDKVTFRLGNWLTSLGADKRLALSFQEYSDEKMKVVPPLLRKDVQELNMTNEGHLLIYLLNYGYAREIDKFHQDNPEIVLHCFWDKPDTATELKVDATLTYHQLDGEKFLRRLSSCHGYVTTAGFESVCEAMYLNKPVMIVPVQGHYEQACNALDATIAGAGVSVESFDLSIFLDYLPNHKTDHGKFKDWCEKADHLFLKNLVG